MFSFRLPFLLPDLLQKPPETLVMNQAEEYRQTQEERYIIDRAIPAMDYGKGCKLKLDFVLCFTYHKFW